MSFDRNHARGGSHGPTAAAGTIATPGKRTQVDLLPETMGGHAAPHGVPTTGAFPGRGWLASVPGSGGGADAAGNEHAKHGHHHEHEIRAHGAAAVPEGAQKRQEAAAASESSPSDVDMAKLKALISKHEGYRDHVYVDSRGNLTAGIGHLLTDGHYHVGQKVSVQKINEWFQDDVAQAISGAKRDLGAGAYDRLNEWRKMAVIDMVFNLGAAGFAGFTDTIHAIRIGDYARAANEMLHSAWHHQVGKRAEDDAAIMRGRTIIL